MLWRSQWSRSWCFSGILLPFRWFNGCWQFDLWFLMLKKAKLNGSMRLKDLLELTPKNDVLFIIGDWNAKVGSQQIPGVTGKIWPWSAEWGRAKAKRVLPREHTGHSKHPLPTTQEKTLLMDITRWSTPKSDWLYSLQPKMEKHYTVSKNKTGSWLWLRSWTPYCQIQT